MQARLSSAARLPETPGLAYYSPTPDLVAKPLAQRAKPVTPLDQMYAYFTAE